MSISTRLYSTRRSLKPFFFKSSRLFSPSSCFSTQVTQLGPKFQDEMPVFLKNVPSLIEQNVLTQMSVTVNQSKNRFSFNKNGFEFHHFSHGPFRNAIETFSDDLRCKEKHLVYRPEMETHEIPRFQRALEKEMFRIGKEIGLEFDEVVCADAVCRDTGNGRFGAVFLAHIDFPLKDSKTTLKGHSEWRESLVKKLGSLTQEEYENLKIVKIMNAWLPLDDKVVASPLAVMDIQTVDESDIRQYQAERANGGKFPALGVMPRIGQRWYIKKDLGKGDVYIFDSCRTPHTAVKIPDQGDKSRKSVECRVFFIKK